MLRGEDHVGGPEEGVRPGGEDHDAVPGGGLEGDLRGLIDDLDELDFIDRVKTQQKNWIGRSTGAEVTFQSSRRGRGRSQR